MTASIAEQTVADLVRERIGRSRVFEKFGIDFCCGGNQPLTEACRRAGVDLGTVCRELEQADAAPVGDEPDWTHTSLGELVEDIVARHHAYLRTELPRITGLFNRVVAAHAEHDPRLSHAARVFASLQQELMAHMGKEEQVLFPIVREMERAAVRGAGLPRFHCGSVNNPIGVMEDEHRFAGEALASLRQLTDGFTPPATACDTYRALLAALAELETDLHRHIHKENNILFPRAAALEASLAP